MGAPRGTESDAVAAEDDYAAGGMDFAGIVSNLATRFAAT